MSRRSMIPAFLIVFAFTATEAGADLLRETGGSADRHVRAMDMRCGTPEVRPEEVSRVERAYPSAPIAISSDILIPLAVHVVYDNGVWNVPETVVKAQKDVLNAAFAGTGFQFRLVSIDRTLNGTWAHATQGSAVEADMKNALAVDPATTLNLYTLEPGLGSTGWASFPWSHPEGDPMDGVVILADCFPGGAAAYFNEGDIAVHEVGHWLGLYHTFQGGCNGDGDFVEDTPPQRSANYGCPVGMNSCSGGGADAIHNYMDFTDDACMYEFTSGQGSRMREQVEAHRPTIWATKNVSVANDPAGEVRLGNRPNPFHPGTRIFFQIPRAGRVVVRVHDLAGRLIRSIGDHDAAPGRHSLWWDGRDRNGVEVGSGLYFYTLHLDGVIQGPSRKMTLAR